MLPKARFHAIPIKLSMMFFTEPEQIILNFVMKHERWRIAKEILRKSNKAESITSSSFQTILQSYRNFPGNPVVKIPHFHYRQHGFSLWSGN